MNALRAQLAAVQSNIVLQLNGRLTLNAADPTSPTALFTGVNVQIVNGTGNTASANGLGNLVIGYDMARNDNTFFCSIGPYADAGSCANAGGTWAPSHKTGSHYLIIGDQNNYSRWAGLVVGYRNTSNAQYASVSGGGYLSGGFISGNTANGTTSSVSGGFNRSATFESSWAAGTFSSP